jgi:hypothetical protein
MASSTRPKTLSRMTARRIGQLGMGDHTDSAVPGLQLRVRAARGTTSRTWLMRYKWRDAAVRLVIGHWPATRLAAAREKVLALRKGMDEGIDPRRARPRRNALPAPLPPFSPAPTNSSPNASDEGAPILRDPHQTREYLRLHLSPKPPARPGHRPRPAGHGKIGSHERPLVLRHRYRPAVAGHLEPVRDLPAVMSVSIQCY